MKLFLDVAKHRLLPAIGWVACSVLSMFVGGILGIWIGYLCLATGLMEATDKLFSGWAFLTFPFVGGIIGLITMHIVRTLCWIKLHRSYMKKYERWTWKYTIGIVFLDEIAWLITFTTICLLLATAM